jgi:hypothetical protein
MKCLPLLAALSAFSRSYGGGLPAELPLNPYRVAPPELPEAVKQAVILEEAVTQGGLSKGKVTIQRVVPPLLPPLPEAQVVQSPAPDGEWRAALRATAPLELRLFAPTVICYADGLSFVRWTTSKGEMFEAWTKMPDLSSIYAAGDFTVERCRYLMMPLMFQGNTRAAGPLKLPDLTQFKQPTDVILVRGDPANAAALTPLMGLLEMVERDGAMIAAAAKAHQEAAAAATAWEKANPPPDRPDVVIKVWPIQSTQYSTTSAK